MDVPTNPGPLPDLHRHLDGSLRPSTLVELASRHGVALPADIRFTPGMGLGGALDRFRVTLACLQQPDDVARVAAEICEDAAADGVDTLEVRFAPQLHRGAPMEHIVDAALDGLAGRAGLILCVLYGESPDLAGALVRLARGRKGIVGLDLAGGPTPGHTWSMAAYAPAFEAARDLGLGRTVHAGEGRPAAEIAVAIDTLYATRIGHGTTLLDDPKLVERVIDRGITIEACPTSNMHTGVVKAVGDHPLPRWLELGVAACINTDNTLLSDVTSREEHRRARAIPGMTDALLARAIEYGRRAAFQRA